MNSKILRFPSFNSPADHGSWRLWPGAGGEPIPRGVRQTRPGHPHGRRPPLPEQPMSVLDHLCRAGSGTEICREFFVNGHFDRIDFFFVFTHRLSFTFEEINKRKKSVYMIFIKFNEVQKWRCSFSSNRFIFR